MKKKTLNAMLALAMSVSLCMPTVAFAGAGTTEDPAELVLYDPTDRSTVNTAEFEENGEYIYEWTPTADGTLNFTIDPTNDDWYVTVYYSRFSSESFSSEDGSNEFGIDVTEDATIRIGVMSYSYEAGTVVFMASFEESSSTQTLSLDVPTTANVTDADAGVDYAWTATEDGTLTITIATDDWFFFINGSMYWMSDYPDNTIDIPVSEGEEVAINVSTDSYTPGTVTFTASFTPGSGTTPTPTPTSTPAPEEPGTPDYVYNWESIGVGDNVINEDNFDDNYTTNIYDFSALETGVYLFTASDPDVIVSFWGTSAYGFDYVEVEGDTYIFDLNYPYVGPSMYIGVTGFCTLNIERIGDAISSGEDIGNLPWTPYVNTVTPGAFTFVGDKDTLTYIDVTDDEEDKLVLGEDGFYHFGTADGPIVYVNIGDRLPYGVSLLEAYGNGQLRAYVYNEDGSFKDKLDFSEAYLEYYMNADEDSLYPLTDDLIEMFKDMGAAQGWYDNTVLGYYLFGNTTVDKDAAWMFACCYAASELKADSSDTGANTPIIPVMAVAVMAMATVTVVVSKKKATSATE